jgi:hypothetical protein
MSKAESEVQNCRACLVAIAKVETRIQILNNNIMKIVYALLGVIGANVGTKFIGTPWHVEVAMYSLMFGAVFVFLITFTKRKCLTFWEKWTRYNFVILCVWVTSLRIYHYQTETAFTKNEGVVTQLITLGMAFGFIMIAWSRDSMMRKKFRRWTDEKKNKMMEFEKN